MAWIDRNGIGETMGGAIIELSDILDPDKFDPGACFCPHRQRYGKTVITAAGPTDNVDAAAIGVLWLDASDNAVTIGGFVNGVDSQFLSIIVKDSTNNVTIEHGEGTGNQDIFLNSGGDETMNGKVGGWTLFCDGTKWIEVAH